MCSTVAGCCGDGGAEAEGLWRLPEGGDVATASGGLNGVGDGVSGDEVW